MVNWSDLMFNSIYEVKIDGKDVKRFVKTLYRRGIELLNICYTDNSIYIKLDKRNYDKLLEIKTIYEIKLTRLYGLAKWIFLLKHNMIFIISALVGLVFLLLLSNITFEIEVVHRKEEIRKLIYKELDRYNIKKYSFIKSFDEQEQIVKNILDNNKNKLEWLEIERVGVKYIIRVEERIINEPKKEEKKRHIVASKDGIIMHIDSSRGEIVKKINDYVKKGDIIISGNINKGEEVKNIVSAEGNVYAEVWYTVDIEMPLVYKEEYKTGKSKKTLTLNLFGNNYSLFDFFPYKNKSIEENIIFKNNVLPIRFSFNKEYELKVIDEVYTYDEAINKAVNLAREKLKMKLSKDEEILYEKKLKTTQNNSTILVTVFFKVYENITAYEEILEDKDLTDNKKG